MSRIVCNVSTDSWVKGQMRLCNAMAAIGERVTAWSNTLPPGSPPHRTRGACAGRNEDVCRPYAFKAYAMKQAADAGHTSLLWCDASIIPVKPLAGLWDLIEEHGVWLSRNGWMNSDWTADSAYRDLFPTLWDEDARALNATIPHVVATCFGVSVAHPRGRAFMDEYYRLASSTRAFCGPWANTLAPSVKGRNVDRPAGPCGPSTTLGHRHDQTAASVLAWRLGVELTNPPYWFAYEGGETEHTVLMAKGI